MSTLSFVYKKVDAQMGQKFMLYDDVIDSTRGSEPLSLCNASSVLGSLTEGEKLDEVFQL